MRAEDFFLNPPREDALHAREQVGLDRLLLGDGCDDRLYVVAADREWTGSARFQLGTAKEPGVPRPPCISGLALGVPRALDERWTFSRGGSMRTVPRRLGRVLEAHCSRRFMFRPDPVRFFGWKSGFRGTFRDDVKTPAFVEKQAKYLQKQQHRAAGRLATVVGSNPTPSA
jgi:hypothetical protein